MPRQAENSRSVTGVVVLLALALLLSSPTLAQQPTPGDKPTAPSDQPADPRQPAQPRPPAEPTPPLEPVQVIPGLIPNQPPSTIPSGQQRVLPMPTPGVPTTAIFQFQPSVSLIEEYTDNFNLTKSDKESNFRSTISPGIRLLINSAFTKGILDYRFAPSYDTATDDIEFFHTLLGQVVWDVTPLWKLTLSDTLTRGDQPGEADRLGLRSDRRTFTTNTISLTSDFLLGIVATRQAYQNTIFSDDTGSETISHTLAASAIFPVYQTNSITVAYDYLTSKTTGGDNGSNTSSGIRSTTGDSEVDGHQLTLSGSRRLTTQASVGLTGSYGLRSFEDDTGTTDFQVWNASIFSSYTLPGRLSLRGSAGVTGIQTDTENLGPGFFTLTSLTYQFVRATAALSLDKGFSETFSGGENFGVVDTEGVTGSLTYSFTPTLSGTASAFYRRNKSTGIGNDSDNTSSTGDSRSETWGGSIGFGWRILRGLLLDVTYTYVNQSSDSQGGGGTNDTNSYTENRVRAGLTFNF
jgi:hypothetical protein